MGNADAVGCDAFGKLIPKMEWIYHCPAGYNEIHEEGFDICMDCFDTMSMNTVIIKDVVMKSFRNMKRIVLRRQLRCFHSPQTQFSSKLKTKTFSSSFI